MKKLLTICLIMATVFTVSAQTKPTKEETIAFIRKTCESTRLKTWNYITIIQTTFDYENSSIEYLVSGNKSNTIDKFSYIKWENYSYLSNYDPDNGIIELSISFSSNVKLLRDGVDGKDAHSGDLTLYIPESKLESIKKAIERLSEIAKEENKDPFKD